MTTPEFIQGMALLILHGAALNIPFDDVSIKIVYRTALGHIPGDLFLTGMRRVLAGWVDTFRLPPPATVLAEIQAELNHRHAMVRKVQYERDNPPEPDIGPKMTQQEIDAIVRPALNHLKQF